jgi:hypothetical protein
MDKPLTDIRYDAATGRTTFHFCGGSGMGEHIIQNSKVSNSYDLLGRPHYSPSSGIYIQNGKKLLHD